MYQPSSETFIHPSAEVSFRATIGEGVKIWDHVHIREDAIIGDRTIIGKGVYVDAGVRVGADCKLQNGCYIYRGTLLDDGVFVGPGACFTNDRVPRALNAEGQLKQTGDWVMGTIRVCYGASIGAGVILVPDLVIGRFAMVGAGAVVTRDVPDHGLVVGVRGQLIGFVCRCGARLRPAPGGWRCSECASLFAAESLRESACG